MEKTIIEPISEGVAQKLIKAFEEANDSAKKITEQTSTIIKAIIDDVVAQSEKSYKDARIAFSTAKHFIGRKKLKMEQAKVAYDLAMEYKNGLFIIIDGITTPSDATEPQPEEPESE